MEFDQSGWRTQREMLAATFPGAETKSKVCGVEGLRQSDRTAQAVWHGWAPLVIFVRAACQFTDREMTHRNVNRFQEFSWISHPKIYVVKQ